MATQLKISDIVNVIREGAEIPTLAPVMSKVVAACSASNNGDALVEITKCDVAFTSRIIRAANNPARFKSSVYDVKSAVKRLGLKASKNIILATGFIDPAENQELYNTFQWLWDRNLFNSVAAQVFSRLSTHKTKISYPLIGILMEIGVWFLLYHFPDHYRKIIERYSGHGGALHEFEVEEFGFDHSIIGQSLVREWHLGKETESVVRFHHSENDKDSNLDPSVFHLAQLTTGFFFENRFANGLEPVSEYAAEKFGIDSEKLRNLLQEISLEAEGMSIEIALGSEKDPPYVELLRSVNLELSREMLSYDQMVRELKAAKQKAESLAKDLKEANVRLRDVSNQDPLTKVYNRRYFNEFLGWNFNRATRYESMLGCMMVDIDFFKRVNDKYGHLTGDFVLQNVATILQESLRNTDVVARFGGEEFVVLLPETDADAVMSTAERIRLSIENGDFKHGEENIHITVSIGYVAYDRKNYPEIRSFEDLIKTTDERMYKAKKNGRNQICPPFIGEKAREV